MSILPKFTALDINGKIVNSLDFEGKYTYIQFIDPTIPSDIVLFDKVKTQWANKSLKIIAVPKNLENFLLHVSDNPIGIDILVEYEKMQTLMKAAKCCETMFLYDPKGILLAQVFNSRGYERGIKPYLMLHLDNKQFDISLFAEVDRNINNYEWFQQVADIVKKKENNHYLVTLITSYCQSCTTKTIIDRLMDINAKSANEIKQILIMNRENHTKQDILNMKDQLNIKFDVYRADDNLMQKWRSLIQEYIVSDLTNIILLINDDGKIINIANPSCNCFRDFFMKVDQLMEVE